MMSPEELSRWRWRSFEELLKYVCTTRRPQRVLEWGPGRSTRIILDNSQASILTIEHDETWYAKAVNLFGNDPRVEVVKRTISMKGGESDGYCNYPLWRVLETHPPDRARTYDLIFVDGRMRCDCLVAANLLVTLDGAVVLHDAHRDNYLKMLNLFPYSKVFPNTRTAVASHTPLDWLNGFDEDKVPEVAPKDLGLPPHSEWTCSVMSDEATMEDLGGRLASCKPFTYLRFGDADLFFIDDPLFNGNKRHDRNPAMSMELGNSFSVDHPDYLIGCVAGGKVFASKDGRLREIASRYHSRRQYHSAVALHQLYAENPEGFAAFVRKGFHGRRVLFIGGKSVARDSLVRKVFHVVATIEFTDRNAYNMLDDKMAQIEKNVPKFDVIVSALGQATRVLGWRLWSKGYRTQYFDVGSCVDALAGRPLRSWICRNEGRREEYLRMFV